MTTETLTPPPADVAATTPAAPITLATIALDSLPVATRELAPDKRALADAMLAAIIDGTNGTTYQDADGANATYATEPAAAAAAAAAKRLVAKVLPDDSGRIIRTRTIANAATDDAPASYGWIVYTAAKPAPAKGKGK